MLFFSVNSALQIMCSREIREKGKVQEIFRPEFQLLSKLYNYFFLHYNLFQADV